MAARNDLPIYSATYSNVGVFNESLVSKPVFIPR